MNNSAISTANLSHQRAAQECITQIDFARAGIITPQMQAVAIAENLCADDIREAVACGRIAIPANIHHASLKAGGVGSLCSGIPLSTKVNVNLGISGDMADEAQEWKKVDIALSLGADAIMDLSNSGKTENFRKRLVERSSAMIGTVPMYDAIGYLEKALINITAQDFLDVIRKHAEDGVDFVTVHAGMNRRVIDSFKETGRLANIVSRGGSLIFAWMEATGSENPFYEHYDEVLSILHSCDVTISIGDAMRPGSTYDASDAAQIAELIEIGKLTKRAWDAGVQVMVEGPGHMALDEIEANMKMEKRLCHNAPFYVLGPLVCDIAPGYDHITAAIGGAVAAASGADFLCYVTPAEHLRLPDENDVREGLVATKIAAHAADIAKGVKDARVRDNKMSDARRRVAWDEMFELSLDPVRAKEYFASAPPTNEGTCTMCGKMCAMRTVNQLMENNVVDLGL
ncbi:phosphomethylpyrimidine synthase ThiC [Adlercreutzia sp. ZJ304]|uniref:phosphomethylpyrimidine synthase ThiC n=1 Tax=Adlercreutzia sp. ZJ304 TaxID=2709791 RepID=UPI0013EB74E1|nr:phosphomethylpyrimidine synthase ThiC [Adlercreutzia sp. ZJ304]